MTQPSPKPVIWLGDTLPRLRACPQDVQDEVGYALCLAQIGEQYGGATPLKGLGPGVLEVVADHRGDTYRAIYTVRFAERVYVLHVLQKKSKKGLATPQSEIELVRQRLKRAAELDQKAGALTMARKKDYVVGSGNVFADLGYARPEEAAAKAELAHKITKIIERRKLTQAEAADALEVDQPKVSALKRGKLSGFSLDRLVRFLVLLGSDVEIVVKDQPRGRRRAKVLVA